MAKSRHLLGTVVTCRERAAARSSARQPATSDKRRVGAQKHASNGTAMVRLVAASSRAKKIEKNLSMLFADVLRLVMKK